MTKKNNSINNNTDPYNFEKIEAPRKEQAELDETTEPIMGKSYQKSKKNKKG